MYKRLLLFIIFLVTVSHSFAQLDTIRTYKELDQKEYFSNQDYSSIIARILPERPCSVGGFTIHLDGGIGSCWIHLYGHEGGAVMPFLKKDLIEPIEILKANEGDTSITILLENQIDFDNDQFFIAFDQFKGNLGLKTDTQSKIDYCRSANGGNYYPSFVLDRKLAKFVGKARPIALDIILSYVPTVDPYFFDITKDKGLPTHKFNSTAAWADVDKDLWLDLLIGDQLYLNKGGVFELKNFQSLLTKRNKNKRSAFIDMNNDGNWDIILFNQKKSWLYLNEGKGDFKRYPLSIPSLTSLQSFSIADINKDGFPDLVLVQLWSDYPVPKPNYLLLNNQSLDFENITARLYPDSTLDYNFPDGKVSIANNEETNESNSNRNKRSRASQFVDYDQDGDQDLYVTNYYLETDELFENDGSGFFTKVSVPKPALQNKTTDNNGTGVAWYDYDNDGDFDLLVPQLAHPRNILGYDHRGSTLYENRNGQFKDITASSGIQYEETHAGSAFGDINNDGQADLITTVYYGCRFVDLYIQQEDHSFKMSTHHSGFQKLSTGSEVGYVDYNNDGKQDVFFAKEGAFLLFENKTKNRNNWIKFNVKGKNFNHFGIGAMVKVYAGNEVYTREISSGKGQGLQGPTTLHFGLGRERRVDRVELWYGGRLVSVLKGLRVNRSYLLVE